MKKFNLATLVCLSLLSTHAFAGGAAPFYLGATIGKSKVNNNVNQMDDHGLCASADGTKEVCNIGDGDTAGHIYGGIQLSDSIAVEAGYAVLGTTADYYYSDPVDVKQETSGFTLAGVARHRLSKSSPVLIYGKAGVFRWTSEVESTIDYPGKTKASGVSPMAGVGVEYELNPNMSLKAGWDRYFEVGEGEHLLEIEDSDDYRINTLATDVDVYSAGLNFSFF